MTKAHHQVMKKSLQRKVDVSCHLAVKVMKRVAEDDLDLDPDLGVGHGVQVDHASQDHGLQVVQDQGVQVAPESQGRHLAVDLVHQDHRSQGQGRDLGAGLNHLVDPGLVVDRRVSSRNLLAVVHRKVVADQDRRVTDHQIFIQRFHLYSYKCHREVHMPAFNRYSVFCTDILLSGYREPMFHKFMDLMSMYFVMLYLHPKKHKTHIEKFINTHIQVNMVKMSKEI